jgi:hypothetical protein
MSTVNKYMLEDLISPIGGTADIDDERSMRFMNTNGDDENAVKRIMEEEIKPYFQRISPPHQSSIKRSLSYFLTTDRADFEFLYNSCLIALKLPSEPRDFFLWIWEVLFPDEDYRLKNPKDFEEVDDIYEADKYW